MSEEDNKDCIEYLKAHKMSQIMFTYGDLLTLHKSLIQKDQPTLSDAHLTELAYGEGDVGLVQKIEWEIEYLEVALSYLKEDIEEYDKSVIEKYKKSLEE